MFSNLSALLGLIGLSRAHFHVKYPEWRADSLTTETASQWSFPCANISETTDVNNRTQWPTTGGSLSLSVSHYWALTYVNLGIGTNVSSFNISLVNGFNQTGNGTFCLKETDKAALEAGLAKANLSTERLDGMQGSLQIIQISTTGASLYNCADFSFNASVALLPDGQCINGTDVGGIAIQNVGATVQSSIPTGAANALGSGIGRLVVAVVVAWTVL